MFDTLMSVIDDAKRSTFYNIVQQASDTFSLLLYNKCIDCNQLSESIFFLGYSPISFISHLGCCGTAHKMLSEMLNEMPSAA